MGIDLGHLFFPGAPEWRIRAAADEAGEPAFAVARVAPDGAITVSALIPVAHAPDLIEGLIVNYGDADAAARATVIWIELLCAKHGVHGGSSIAAVPAYPPAGRQAGWGKQE